MISSSQPKLTFHRRTFFELSTPSRTLFIDPVFSRERRGRRVTDPVRSCDYLIATSVTPWFDDALDVLDQCEATFVSSPKLRRVAVEELDLSRDRLLDLEPWERASESGLRITALPITASLGMEGTIREGASIVQDMGKVFPQGTTRIPVLGAALPMVQDGVRNASRLLGNVGALGQPRSLDRLGDLVGLDVGRLTGGRPGLGYLFEIDGYGSLMHLADGIHEGTSDDDLEDMAEVCEPDLLVVQAAGMAVEPLVRAARILNPRKVLLYRARDPYRRGRREQTLPMSSFLGALEEGAPDCQGAHVRSGRSVNLERARAAVTAAAEKPKAAAAPAKSS